jgi:hypothetical protein
LQEKAMRLQQSVPGRILRVVGIDATEPKRRIKTNKKKRP